jgi:hypothetical protein
MQDTNKARWTQAQGKQAVAAWRRSGKPLARYARETGTAAWRLRWWSARLEAESKGPGRASFIPVVVRPEPCPKQPVRRGTLRVRIGAELSIELDDHASWGDVAALVSALRAVLK